MGSNKDVKIELSKARKVQKKAKLKQDNEAAHKVEIPIEETTDELQQTPLANKEQPSPPPTKSQFKISKQKLKSVIQARKMTII